MHHPYLDALFQFEAGWHAVVRTAFTTRAVELIEQWQERAVGLMSHSCGNLVVEYAGHEAAESAGQCDERRYDLVTAYLLTHHAENRKGDRQQAGFQ